MMHPHTLLYSYKHGEHLCIIYENILPVVISFRRDRLNNGLSLYIENSGSMKISKEGLGVQQAWRQQLQQFKNVKAEVANAIMGQYCSPIELWKVGVRPDLC